MSDLRKQFQERVEKLDTKVVKHYSEELGIDVWLKLLRASEQSALAARINQDPKAKANYSAEYLAACLCDESGKLLFPGEFGVVDLSNMPAKTLSPILDAAHKANGILTKEEQEEARKNSVPTVAPASSTN